MIVAWIVTPFDSSYLQACLLFSMFVEFVVQLVTSFVVFVVLCMIISFTYFCHITYLLLAHISSVQDHC